MEASIRKPPQSLRHKRAVNEVPVTPMHVPPEIRAWNEQGILAASTSQVIDETPLRAKKGKAKATHPPGSRLLPGFENAFTSATPLRSPRQRLGLFQGNEDRLTACVPDPFSPPSSPSHPDIESDVQMGNLNARDIDAQRNDTTNADADIVMGEEEYDASEEVDPIEPFDWKTEVRLGAVFQPGQVLTDFFS